VTLFDRYVVVDWSASARPTTGRDSIWMSVLGDGEVPVLTNPPTRAAAAEALGSLVDDAGEHRTLIAVDASLGYPCGSAEWCRLTGEPPWWAWWASLARSIVDDEANRNNRFDVAADLNRRSGGPGPFWGRPRARDVPHLGATKPKVFAVPEFRLAEMSLRRSGHRPSSCWQLLGAGSVGSQTLTVVPRLHDLLERSSHVEVWPFTTGLDAPELDPGATLIAETWPTAFEIDLSAHPIRDAAQVAGVTRQLRAADQAGTLRAWFSPEMAGADRAKVEQEEGWVLAPTGTSGANGR